MALAAVSIPTTYAVHNDDLFELGPGVATDENSRTNILGDGNALNGPDWADIFGANGNLVNISGGLVAAFLKDDLSQSGAVDRSTYSGAGGSNKNNDPIAPPGDTWHWDTGNIPAKDDLSNVYAWGTMSPAGDLVIYAGFERIDASGDSHIDVELFQAQVGLDDQDNMPPCDGNPIDTHNGCHFFGDRTDGDIIVSMDFLNGGALGSVSVRQWSGTSYGSAVATLTGEGCNTADTICAFNNGGSISGGPWPNYDRHGTEITNLPTNAFTEFGLDVTALLHETPCLSTILGKTRSSQSFTAELKDFDGPLAFPICSATIAIAPDDVNEINEHHTFTVWVNATAGGVSTPADDGTIVTVTLTPADGASVTLISDTCADPGTVDGICTVEFTSPTAGSVTGHARAQVNVQGFIFDVQTNGEGGSSGDALKFFVDAFITIGPSAANEVGTPHPFTVHVESDDGTGVDSNGDGFTFDPVAGAMPSITFPGGAPGFVDASDCNAGTDANGDCTVIIRSDVAGTFTAHASVTLLVDGVSLHRETDGSLPNSGDATKVFVDASISITPPGVNEIGDPHTFTVTVMQDDGSGSGFVPATVGHVSFTLSDSDGATHVLDPVASTCDDAGDNLDASGQCTIVFTSSSAGTVTGHATVMLTVAGVPLTRSTDGEEPNSGDVDKAFFDAFITIGRSAHNEVGTPHPFTVHVEFDDGTGIDSNGDGLTFDPIEGAIPTITFVDNTPAFVDTSDCDAGTDANGNCTVIINSEVAGTFTAHASVTFLVQGVSLHRETDGSGFNSGNAEKVYVDAFITITPSAANPVGFVHPFTVHVEADDGSGIDSDGDGSAFDPAPGVFPVITWVGAQPEFVDTSDCDDGTDANGNCTVLISSSTAGTFTAHASVSFLVEGVTLDRETDGSLPNSGDATKVFVDAFITIGRSAHNAVGTPHPFTVHVEFDDGTGIDSNGDGLTFDPIEGAVPTITFVDNTPAFVDTSDCDAGTDANGNCTVIINSEVAGTFTAHAMVTVLVADVSLTRATDGHGFNSGDAQKIYVDAFITLTPLFDTNEVNELHRVTVHVEADDGSGFDANGDGSSFDPVAGALPVITFPGGAPGFVDTTDCDDGTDASGNCDVFINSDVAGSFFIHAAVTLDVEGVTLDRQTDGFGLNSGDAQKVYVDARISLSPLEAANEVDAEHTITATVEQDDGRPAADPAGDGVDGFGPAPEGTLVEFSFAFNSAGATFVGPDFCYTSVGSCSIVIVAHSAGTVVVHATTTFSVGGETLTRATGTDGQNSADAIKIFIDARIFIGPDDTNGIGEEHTFTVLVLVDYGGGAGPQAVPEGTHPTVTLTDVGGAVNIVSSDTCFGAGTDPEGTCTVTFTSNFAGTVTGHAAVTFTVLGVTLTRETNNTHGSSGNATKIFIAGSIVWHKVDNVGRALGGATFEVCRTMTLDTSTNPDTMVDTPDVCISVLDDVDGIAGGTLDEDPAPGEFSLSGLVLGEYTVREDIAPPGYVKDPDIVTVDLTLENPTVEITEPFRDARPSLKLTSFGYTNTPTGVPGDGVVSGTTVYSFSVKNFGGADALLNLTFNVTVPGGAGSGTVTYGGSGGSAVASSEPGIGDDCIVSGCMVEWTGVAVASGAEVSFTVTIVYDHVADGTQIRADLGATYTVDPSDGVTRMVSGAPAIIIFTVQED